MIAIICLKDDNIPVPIIKDDDGIMATWRTMSEAKEFAEDNILCQISECIYIDLDNIMIIEP